MVLCIAINELNKLPDAMPEDMYGLKIDEVDGEVVLRLNKSDYSTYSTMDKMLRAWLAEAKKLESGESTKEQYDDWRYKYPELDTHQNWA